MKNLEPVVTDLLERKPTIRLLMQIRIVTVVDIVQDKHLHNYQA
jgi:hypothetical protein